MLKRIWNRITDPDEIASGLTVISSIIMAGTSLLIAVSV